MEEPIAKSDKINKILTFLDNDNTPSTIPEILYNFPNSPTDPLLLDNCRLIEDELLEDDLVNQIGGGDNTTVLGFKTLTISSKGRKFIRSTNAIVSYLDHIKDDRVNCYSVLLKIKIKDYLSFIEGVYHSKGGIEGQRSPLKTKSAQRIRKRLIEDLKRGTVIPPIVLGLKLENDSFKRLETNIESQVANVFATIKTDEQVSIIDGMQRTTALFEAFKDPDSGHEKKIRLELWIAESTHSLIYRMLVLNTGQIPWSIKRQLEVVFSQFRKELEAEIDDLILFSDDDPNSRTKGGQYQANQFIELFMLFGARRINIDIQEELAEEFARLDIIETSGNEGFMQIFKAVSKLLVNLDIAFCQLQANPTDITLNKFKTGKHIFSSQPARAGFIVSLSQEIFGIPGMELNKEEHEFRFKTLNESIDKFIDSIRTKTQEELFNIIDLPTLDEHLNIKTSKVGEFERSYFLKAFKTFIDLAKSNSLTTLTPCWRSSY